MLRGSTTPYRYGGAAQAGEQHHRLLEAGGEGGGLVVRERVLQADVEVGDLTARDHAEFTPRSRRDRVRANRRGWQGRGAPW